jgi:hypothetical protein
MTFPRVASSLAPAIAIVLALAATSPSWAAVRSSGLTAETGHQGELVNRPGCDLDASDDGSKPCDVVGGR